MVIGFILHMAKCSNSIHTTEHRLILLIFPGVSMVVSLLLYGFTVGGNSTWSGRYIGMDDPPDCLRASLDLVNFLCWLHLRRGNR